MMTVIIVNKTYNETMAFGAFLLIHSTYTRLPRDFIVTPKLLTVFVPVGAYGGGV